MPKKMPMKERTAMILDIANKLEHDYPNTAKWIKHLSETIALPKVTVEEFNLAYTEVLDAFRVEYIGSDGNSKYRERCFQAYINLFGTIIIGKGTKTVYDTLESLFPAFQTKAQTLMNIQEIYQALINSNKLTEKRKYYSLCLVYVLFVEGIYDEVIRILYTIKKAIEDEKVDYESIKDWDLRKFESDLDPVLFECYNNHIIANQINI